jgi:hypothetical protein
MTMRLRLAFLLVVLTAAGSAHAASGAASGPTGLHGFLFRADEPAAQTYHRTPSFAWDPVPGALHYQFQLSMSGTFRENAIFYNTNTPTTPVDAPDLTLPWITGSPHSLYARVRALLDTGEVTPWSATYGFDVLPPAPPRPLPSTAGLLRWTPTEGATGYQVWLIDVPKKGQAPGLGKENVHTNVLDEREFYTFHQSNQWIGTVRWRVRAMRSSEAGGPADGLPVTTYGAWSPIYTSTNPAVGGGPITLGSTISDVTSNGSDGSPTHRLMPAFTWSGSQTVTGESAELFRVYVFTDKQCLNRVFTSAVVGSPAYAPRTGGPLGLPTDSSSIAKARGAYLDDGVEPNGEMFDQTPVTAQEQLAAATPATSAPADQGISGTDSSSAGGGSTGTGSTGGSTGTGSTGGASTGGSTGSGSTGGGSTGSGTAGAPVDLWDTDTWPKGGYYWTVVGVQAVEATVGSTTVAAPGASEQSTLVPVSDTSQFVIGQSVTIGVAPNSDTATIAAIGNGLITLSSPLNHGHAVGEPIASTTSSAVVYRDMELPQDVCKQRGANPISKQDPRIARFGIASEPALTTGQDVFATGLSPNGRLVSASRTSTFYGQPLVAWAPVLSAHRYQLQWMNSSKPYPFVPTGSLITPATSAVLPLGTGNWYYRVRGFDDNLPAGAQALSWSATMKITIASPTFRVAKATKKKPTFKILGGTTGKKKARKPGG